MDDPGVIARQEAATQAALEAAPWRATDDASPFDWPLPAARCSRCGVAYSDARHRAEHAFRSQPLRRLDGSGVARTTFLWPDGRW